MTYLSANQIATKFSSDRAVAGETVNIKLSHKQSAWLMRQAEYDKQWHNNFADGEILDDDGNVVGKWRCASKYMRNNVFVLQVSLYQSDAQKQAHNADVLTKIENAKQTIARIEQLGDGEYKDIMVNDMLLVIKQLESQLN